MCKYFKRRKTLPQWQGSVVQFQYQVPVVTELDSAIHQGPVVQKWITLSTGQVSIQWITQWVFDSAVQRLNNEGHIDTCPVALSTAQKFKEWIALNTIRTTGAKTLTYTQECRKRRKK